MGKATSQNPFRRTILFALLCLLLGAANTAAVAWYFQLRQSRGLPEAFTAPPTLLEGPQAAAAGWPVAVPADWPRPQFISRIWMRGRLQESAGYPYSASGGPGANRLTYGVGVHNFGWPLLALRRIDGQANGQEWGEHAHWEPGWHFDSWRSGIWLVTTTGPMAWTARPMFACQPVWPGFATDTILYAIAWYLLLFTPLALYRTARHRLRASKGLCLDCAYDFKASPSGVCPECGRSAEVKA